MGLNISHGAFDGGYSRFNRLRKGIMQSIGGSFPPHSNDSLSEYRWYWRSDGEIDGEYNRENYDGLYVLMCHSDCDGEIELDDVKLIKRDLEKILPLIKNYEEKNGTVHLVKDTQRFIIGCKNAIDEGSPLIFG